MKKGIHPQDYRDVVFQDEAAGFMFLTKSTAQTDETIEYEGKEYPLVKVYISSKSHPFFTGEEKIIDTEGRVDRFAAKMKAAETAKKAKLEKLTAKKASVAKPSTSRGASGAVVSEAIDSAAETVIGTVEKIADAKEEVVEKVAKKAKSATKAVEKKLNEAEE